MLDERVLYLINADIDGELGPAEEAELAAILEQSEEARTLRAEWIRMANLLESAPPVEPPPGFADQVISRIRLPRRKPSFSFAALRQRFQVAPAAAAFAAGVLLTLGISEWAGRSEGQGDITRMVGTMVANPQPAPAKRAHRLAVRGPGFAGTVARGERGSFVVLDFEFESAGPTEIVVDLAESGLRFGGLAREATGEESAAEQLQVSGGTVRVANQGRQRFSVFLSRTASKDGGDRAIGIGVSTGGETAFTGTLSG